MVVVDREVEFSIVLVVDDSELVVASVELAGTEDVLGISTVVLALVVAVVVVATEVVATVELDIVVGTVVEASVVVTAVVVATEVVATEVVVGGLYIPVKSWVEFDVSVAPADAGLKS